jgi:hypothetical protein
MSLALRSLVLSILMWKPLIGLSMVPADLMYYGDGYGTVNLNSLLRLRVGMVKVNESGAECGQAT